jgi:hypothetical protein
MWIALRECRDAILYFLPGWRGTLSVKFRSLFLKA